jgi:hypothetical protein
MGENLSATRPEADQDLEPEFTLEQLLDTIYREFHVPELGAGEFTVGMYAERHGLSVPLATRDIDAAVAAGRIECVGERALDGRKRSAYRLK